MNEETMRKHYEATPKDRLINILISSRKEFNKLQNKNKEFKQEIERLNDIINELEKYIKEDEWTSVNGVIAVQLIKNKLQELKGSDKE